MSYIYGHGAVAASTILAPAVSASAYSSGQVVGGLLTVADMARVPGGSGLVQYVEISFAGGAVASFDVVVFDASPSTSTIADAAVPTIAAADIPKITGVAHLNDSTVIGATAPSVIQAGSLAMPFQLPSASGTTGYMILITRGAITPASTTDMTVKIKYIQD